jgi:DNA-cytosine methyltransferase
LTVLSLFDGISAGQLALKRAGILVDTYYASEIDRYAISVTQKNFPETIQLGDVTNWREWNIEAPDLIIGGSPCQGFSFAGKQLNFDDPRSKLFFDMVDIINHHKPKYFLLENVKMKQEYKDVISQHMGVQPMEINSALVSAQNRKRLYWFNWTAQQPEDKGIVLRDIVEGDAVVKDRGEYRRTTTPDKSQNIDANYWKGPDNRGQRTLIQDKTQYRKLTPVECERLQTFPDGYTEGVSNTQRYKALGNSWTVDVIAHLFRGMK